MAVKEYAVKKDGQVLKTYKSLPAAKQLAEKELANVYCDGACVYKTVPDETDADVAETKTEDTQDKEYSIPAAKFTLTARMNVRKKPSLEAEIEQVLEAGSVVEVDAVVDDWLYLSNGTFILYSGGKFAKKSG